MLFQATKFVANYHKLLQQQEETNRMLQMGVAFPLHFDLPEVTPLSQQ